MDSRGPLVSAAIVYYNAARFLGEAIDSVLAQSYAHFELLLVNDGSADGSADIAAAYAQRDARVQLLTHPDGGNHGISASRNLAAEHATGTLMAYLDADDLWLPHKLAEQVEILQRHPAAAMVFGALSFARLDGGERRTPPLRLPLDRVVAPPQLLLRCYPLGSGESAAPSDVMVRLDAMRAVGGYEAQFRGERGMFEDQAFFAKMYLRHHVYVSSQSWTLYRLHHEQCSEIYRDRYETVRAFYLDWLEARLDDSVSGHAAVRHALLRARQGGGWKGQLRRLGAMFSAGRKK
jgi:glycosyltransferase involved in cell wall biosynthesis